MTEALVEGLLLIDKPVDWTSFDVVARVRTLTRVKTVGHAGTLDPFATGLLIVLVGKRYTKQQDSFMHQPKKYWCEFQLGVETDTYDRTGQVVKQESWDNVRQISKEDLERVLPQFVGQIQQTVPAFSAVKRQGKKLYQAAREQTLDLTTLPVRTVSITSLNLLSVKKDNEQQKMTVELEVSCGSGTYIRSLVHDIGQILKVGAMVTELRRLQIGDFNISQAVKIDQITSQTVSSYLQN